MSVSRLLLMPDDMYSWSRDCCTTNLGLWPVFVRLKQGLAGQDILLRAHVEALFS
jgi:hypothetical protein